MPAYFSLIKESRRMRSNSELSLFIFLPLTESLITSFIGFISDFKKI